MDKLPDIIARQPVYAARLDAYGIDRSSPDAERLKRSMAQVVDALIDGSKTVQFRERDLRASYRAKPDFKQDLAQLHSIAERMRYSILISDEGKSFRR